MAGNSASAKKGWATRRANGPSRMTSLDNEITRLQEKASGGFVSGLNTNLQRIDEEYVPALKILKDKLTLYEKMRNDASIKEQERGNIYPLISAVRWTVKGGNAESRDLIAANLLRQGPRKFWCSTSWQQRLYEKLLCLVYGFSAFGRVRDIVDGYMIFRDLPYLSPKSFGGPLGPWEWDESGSRLIAVHRAYKLPNGQSVNDERIPIEDLSLAIWEMAGENWEGISLFRSMYKHYTMKDLAEKIAMVNLQNVGVGIPDGELAAGDGTKDAQSMKVILESLRGGSKERAYILRKAGQKVGFLTGAGASDLATPLVDLHTRGISSAGGMQFLGSGNTESGSRASDSVHLVHALQLSNAVKAIMCDQTNYGAGYLQGEVEELHYSNFGEDEECPVIEASAISPTEQLDNLPLVGDLIQKGGLTHDLSLENYTRNSLGLPLLSQEEFDKAKQASTAVNIGGRPNEVGNPDRHDPRNDTNGRRYGLREQAWAGASQLPRKYPSYPWSKSIGA